jgi:hypothetical protein
LANFVLETASLEADFEKTNTAILSRLAESSDQGQTAARDVVARTAADSRFRRNSNSHH